MRPILCQPIDVMRKFDPQVTESSLRNETEGVSPIGNEDWEKITSRIEGVESTLRRRGSRTYMTRRAGHPRHRDTWVTPLNVEYRDVSGARPRIFIELSDKMITEVKGVELRKSWDEFHEIDDWSLDPHNGTINIWDSYLPSWIRDWIEHPGFNARVCYEHGAFGGSDSRAGQTETTESIDEQATSVTVDEVKRLPPSGGVLLIDGEYVSARLTSDGLTLTARGLRGTSAEPHDSGSTVHYCPMHVREAVAAKTAIEVVTYVDKIDEAVGEQFSPQEKTERWTDEWESLLSTSGGFSTL